jgi:hypothetical protein
VSTSQWKDLLRVARHVVQQSVLPDLDVVMPSVRRMPDTETLAVVSCADTKGVAVLTSRLEKQLARQDRLTRAQIGWTVQSTTLDVNSWLAEGVVPPSGDWLDALAAVIETVLYPSTDGV